MLEGWYTPDDQTLPEFGVVLRLGLRLDELRTNDVADAVCHKDGCCHEALLRVACHIRHADSDDEADSAAKEANNGVAHHGRRRVDEPLALPDDGKPGNDGQACQQEHQDAHVGHARAHKARQQDDEETDPAERKLEQDGVER